MKKIKNILVSQPSPKSEKSPYFDLADKYNLTIKFRKFIKVDGISLYEFRTQKIALLNFSAVIITSKSAVDNYFRLAKEMRLVIPITMKFFCTSESIAYYLQKYITYRKRKIFYGERTFEDLLVIINKHKKEKFLLPVADIHKPTIPNKLRKSKIRFTKSVMYRTLSDDLSDIKDVNYDVLVFFSPIDIVSLFKNFPDFEQKNKLIAGFGTSTAKAIRLAGLKLNIKAPTKESPSMTMAIDNFIKKMK